MVNSILMNFIQNLNSIINTFQTCSFPIWFSELFGTVYVKSLRFSNGETPCYFSCFFTNGCEGNKIQTQFTIYTCIGKFSSPKYGKCLLSIKSKISDTNEHFKVFAVFWQRLGVWILFWKPFEKSRSFVFKPFPLFDVVSQLLLHLKT